MPVTLPRALRRGRHRLVRPHRLLVATAAIVLIGLTLVVVINASIGVRPATVGRTLAPVDHETAAPTGPASPAAPAGGAWAPDVQYAVGAQATYDGVAYRCRQAHRSQLTWEPPNTPALWQRL